MFYKLSIFLVVCGLSGAWAGGSGYIEDNGETGFVTPDCLRCICEVVGCHPEENCTGTSCGPFRITYEYWRSAFNKEDNEQEEYRSCTTKAWCSTRTVQEHMKGFLPKCVKDSSQREVCETALALHIFGAKKCTMPLLAEDKQKLYTCMNRRTMAWLTDGRS